MSSIVYKKFALFQKGIQIKASLMYHQKNPQMLVMVVIVVAQKPEQVRFFL